MLRSCNLVLERLSSRMLRACCWACAALVPVGLAAQEGPSLLSLLPTEGRAVGVDQEVHGELRASDHVDHRGNYLQAWEIRGDPGRSVVVDLVSQPLDPYLFVVGPGLGQGLADDDGGSGLNSRLCLEFPASGSYRIVASALGGTTGVYTLRTRTAETDEECDEQGQWQSGPEVALEEMSFTGTLALDRAVEGSFGSRDPVYRGSFVQAWALEGRAGQTVAIDLTSGELDTYLFFLGPGLDLLSDDDGGDGYDSRLCVELPETGTYRIVASTFGSEATGRYELHVTSAPGPEYDGPCPGDMGTDMDMGMASRGVGAADLEALPVVGTLSPGYGHQGTLTSDDPVLDDSYAHAWELHGSAGETLTVELISDDFDCYLYLTGPGLDVLSDDDGAGSLDSRIEVTFPETGTYRVVATTFGDFGTGAYRVRTIRTR